MANTNTIFNSKLINLDRLGEFWAKAKAYIDAADAKFATLEQFNALTTKHDNHETAFGEFVDGYTTWQGTVDAHMSDSVKHITDDERKAWNKAAKDIYDFLNAEDIKEGVIDTLKEIQSYIESDKTGATELIDRVGTLETTTKDHGDRLGVVESAIESTLGSVVNVADAISAAVKAHNESEAAHVTKFEALADKDTELAEAINTAKNDAISTAAGDATSKANTAESNAKGYTDTKLNDYYKKTETYTQTEVNTAVNGAKTAANEYTDGKFSSLTLATKEEVEGLFA